MNVVKQPQSQPQTPRKQQQSPPHTPKSHYMGNRVICATPHKGKELNNYSLGDRLGKGAFAVVYKAIHLQTAQIAAIKQIPLEKIKSVDGIMDEIELLQELQHPNIVSYLGFMKDEFYLNIVLEYCENGSLLAILRKFGSFPENLTARYMRQVLEGLEYLHNQGTIHRDIKGANILTTKDGVAKLADFGVATRISHTSNPNNSEEQGVVGTPHWMAPEIILLGTPTAACDIWSLGATIVELRTGKPPYGDLVHMAAIYAIVQEDSSKIIPVDSSNSLRDFLSLCFQKDPSLRVSASELLKHAWIKKYGEGERVGVRSPEKTIREWNSPSRRRKLAVPSKLNLRQGLLNNGNNSTGNMGRSDSEDIEDDFVTLNVFGSQKRNKDILAEPVKRVLTRKPLEEFVDNDDDTYDLDYESQSISFSKQNASGSNSANTSNNSTSEMTSQSDPFTGFEDLMEDNLDETEISAQLETEKLVNLIRDRKCELLTALLRLCELLESKPQIKKIINERRLLPLVMSKLSEHAPPDLLLAFVQLINLCVSQNSVDFSIGFCIAGGLSFLFSHSKDPKVSSVSLSVVYKMCVQIVEGDDSMSISRQLTFRNDAILFLCSFYDPESSTNDLLCASTVTVLMFESCGPRFRANLWLHFNQYKLFRKLTDLLHLPTVNGNTELQENIYKLLTWFSRCPQDHLSEQVDQRSLRRLVRAYLKLPIGSPYRLTLLQMLKNFSTLVPILDAMQRGNVAPHLIAILRDSVYNASVPKSESRFAANCLVPTLFNYARLERYRQREIAKFGLLSILRDCVKTNLALKEFSFPIFTALVHAGHDECWKALWDANSLEVLLQHVTEPGWQAMAITAISTWLQAQPKKLMPKFIPHINVLCSALSINGGNSETLLSALGAMLDSNRCLLKSLPTLDFFKQLSTYLLKNNTQSNSTRVQALQIIYRIVYEGSLTDELSESGLVQMMHDLLSVDDLPVPCRKLINQIMLLNNEKQSKQ